MRLLDTTFLIDVLRKRERAHEVLESMTTAREPGATTEVNAFELFLGAYRRGRLDPARRAAVEVLLERLEVLPLNRDGAMRAAELLAKLRAEGRDLGLLDALVAGIALASGFETIVTRDEGFRVPGLRPQTY